MEDVGIAQITLVEGPVVLSQQKKIVAVKMDLEDIYQKGTPYRLLGTRIHLQDDREERISSYC